tara:strand:- start:286 stop:2133 length:1848 start_codon:yes stop_codon:yes gene_type:complete
MWLTHLAFVGPRKEPAEVKFGLGLNLVYGPSNTGKSSILDAIDFMFGRDRPLKEITEHEGYQDILLGLAFSNSEKFTLVRSLSGGDLRCFEGQHLSTPANIEPFILRAKRGTKKERSLPEFILSKLELYGKELKRNSRNEKDSLTLRNLLPLLLINETNIQRESSPYIGTQFTKIPVDRSRLKFILTGVDDSSLVPEEKERQTLSRQARLQLMSELIDDQREAILGVTGDDESLEALEEQRGRLSDTLQNENNALQATEVDYRQHLFKRNELRASMETSQDRLVEIDEMLGRFRLLERQYQTDKSRLDNIIEAGTLFVALPSENCPICGAKTADQNRDKACEHDVEKIIEAATREKDKIEFLETELQAVVEQLQGEADSLSETLPIARQDLNSAEVTMRLISPSVSAQRARYSMLMTEQANVEKSISLFRDLDRLEQKKQEILDEAPDDLSTENSTTHLPTSALHKLSNVVSALLQDWGLARSEQVHYDKETDDFVIGGKHRTSNGKGHRAITHAAATLALMKYAEDKNLPFPGFAILDSPLLAYEKPEIDEERVSETDLNFRFFQSLSKWNTRQVIVFENKKSIPSAFAEGRQITHFTKSEHIGRYGFFPHSVE